MRHPIEVEKGIKVSVEDIGIGKPIVFIHDWPVSQKMYQYDINGLFKKGYRFIGIGLRDDEKSDRPWSICDYDRIADYVRKVIDNLDLEDISLSGFSMGSVISMHYMTKHHGHKVSKLMLCGLATQQSDYLYGIRKQQVDEPIQATQENRLSMPANYGKIFFENEVDKEFSEWFHQFGVEASFDAMIKTADGLQNESLCGYIGQIHVPTVILHGKRMELARLVLSKNDQLY